MTVEEHLDATSDPPVRVCYVVSYFHPHQSGAERQALAQGAELARRGHEVHVVTHSVPVEPRDEIIQGIHVHRWVKSFHFGPLFGLTFVVSVIESLKRLRGRYDVIHTHQGLWEAVAVGAGRKWLGNVPTLIQPASSGYYGEAEQLARTRGADRLRSFILRNSAFAAISADIERQWLELGVPQDSIYRTASGVDSTRFHPGPSAVENDLPPRPRVVYTGRLHPQKNVYLLIDIWPDVFKRTGARLILAGDGPDREGLKERARRLGIDEAIEFVGSVADVAEHLRAADAFVLPSVAEGMSNSLLEAMATGLPCVASRIGGNIDLIDEGVSGLLAAPDRPAEWVEAIASIFNDADFAQKLAAAARSQIERTYDLKVVVDRYVEIYRELIERTSSTAP